MGPTVEGEGGGVDADPFWDIQYPERKKRRFGIGVMRDGTSQYGRRGFPGDRIYT